MDLDDDTFRTLFDANPLPMFVTDHETMRFLLVNRAACEYYGWTHDELLAMTLRDIRPVEEVGTFERTYGDDQLRQGPRYSRAGRHRLKDGRVIDVVLEISAVTIGGRRAGLAVVTDVTGISHAERRFRFLVEHCADGIVLVDSDNVIRYVSPAGEKILGFPASAVIGTTGRSRAHPDDLNPAPEAPACGETRHYVTRIKHRDGSWRWVEASMTNLTHEPAVRAYVSNYRDITERRLAEEAIKRSEQNFRSLIERAPVATFVHRDGLMCYVNPAVVALLGYTSAGDIVGRPVLDFVHPDDRPHARSRMAHLEEHGSTTPSIVRMLRVNGTHAVVEVEGMRLDFDGQPSNVIMARDVSERHEMFARMAMVDRMLTVGSLAAGVAHEINNPLAYIGANLEMLARELPAMLSGRRTSRPPEELAALVSDAREGVARVSAIVRDLRSLSRPEDDTRGPVDVIAVLASSVKMAYTEIRHRARVVEAYQPSLPPVRADASRLGQVFLNLLLNAAQAMVDGRYDHNEIRIRAYASDDRVCIEIEDTGVGIPTNVLPRIFDPFFTTKAPGVGTGLGLSISHQIVQSMDGQIDVASTPGVGTTFRLSLPTAAATQKTPDPDQMPELSARVLLVDDEVAVGRSLGELLAPETDVVVVTRAEDALARLARDRRFDAIVCDLMMPEINGIELYARIVRTAPELAPRVIFMTGGAFTPEAREFLASLDRPHLEKPFTEIQLRRAIERVTRAATMTAPGTTSASTTTV